jgi:hypothetical protein
MCCTLCNFRWSSLILAFAAIVVFAVFAPLPGFTQTETVLHYFNGADGANPGLANLSIDSKGTGQLGPSLPRKQREGGQTDQQQDPPRKSLAALWRVNRLGLRLARRTLIFLPSGSVAATPIWAVITSTDSTQTV